MAVTEEEKFLLFLRTMRRIFGSQGWDDIKVFFSDISKDKIKTSILNDLQREKDRVVALMNEVEKW